MAKRKVRHGAVGADPGYRLTYCLFNQWKCQEMSDRAKERNGGGTEEFHHFRESISPSGYFQAAHGGQGCGRSNVKGDNRS